jgi:hypothetical protein
MTKAAPEFQRKRNSPTVFTPEMDACIAEHYATMDNKKIGELLGLSATTIRRRANTNGLKKTEFVSPVKSQIVRLAMKPDGFKCHEIIGDRHNSSSELHRMVSSGKLFKAAVRGNNRDVRYFGRLQDMTAWLKSQTKPSSVTVKHHGPARAPWKPDAPAYYPPGFKITVIPCAQPGFRTSTYSED